MKRAKMVGVLCIGALLLALLAGCGGEKAADAGTGGKELSSDWLDFTFEMDGQVYSVPFAYADIAAEWKLNPVWEKNGRGEDILQPGAREPMTMGGIGLCNDAYVNPSMDEFEYLMRVHYWNGASEEKKLVECSVHWLELDISNAEVYPDVKLAGGITWGSTEEDILAAYGDPNGKTQEDGNHTGYLYESREDSRTMTLILDPEGKLVKISLWEWKE